MSLLTGKPPYNVLEIEEVARSLAERKGVWHWYNSKEAQVVFRIPIFSMRPTARAQMARDGALMLFEFMPPGRKTLPRELPVMSTMKWANAFHARQILQRAREIEFLSGVDKVPSEDELDREINHQVDLLRQICADPRFWAHAVETEAKEQS